ncbi:MAG TPA: tRNA pseudouridine(38-40) synthase TruA [Dehalococcoidia bacterium]|mgnify:FL=1|jgi:tRNA pseudouridine38-40 synthase|nr:tRNA pseudouridine(38-40) synthase TruA [Chloroflexota bacterium]MDP5877270.1 tRNA pseudouridine(38-40) synthase TruA [Dehalococcoidia bacterium]MDP6273660.1 tRNA pseudouridine(38-40) synthase TruA [Dehalococcoidia bacterium]MDP7159931.1 tRNA pseudouridine(38-40) synthase TruA [Dehalococcoidia bacterium]MDP7212453.1 tRNA pseudouridine(38-40) synthase TruA [Dehalococcoidia bacterium]|tara:strand:+ start:2315 stop:3106 length:792 start_codon:yes stop_codon:yes gene_type:complete
MRIGLVIEYDGTDLHGSQLQATDRTVQGEIESVLPTIFGRPVRLYMASRTDAGVHGTGQVGAFNVETDLNDQKIRDAINHYLPEDVAIVCASRVADDFDPRRDATSREYRYTINDRRSRSPFSRHRAAHVRQRLDQSAMNEAATRLVGEHDFAAFAGPATPPDAITVRRVEESGVERNGDEVEFTIRGNAFVHQQVRRVVGALVRVGRSQMEPDQFQELIHRAERGLATDLAPARGLCLTKVNYLGADGTGLPRTTRDRATIR